MNNLQSFLKILFISIVLFCVSCTYNPENFRVDKEEIALKDITKNRDMSQYDQGGDLFCCRADDSKNIKNEEKAVRDFIWQHWTEKRKGYIKLTYVDTDSSHTTYYLIEPDKNGEWVVLWKKLYQHAIPQYDNQPIKDGFGTVEQIESKKRKGDWELVFKPIYGEGTNDIPRF